MKDYNERRQLKDRRIIKYIESKNINIKDKDENIEEKRYFLTHGMQYENLRVASNKNKVPMLSIDDCNNERVNSVVRDIYNAAKIRKTKYDKCSKKQLEFMLE